MDVDNGIELQTSGNLQITVGKDVYEELGLIGEAGLVYGRTPANYS